MGQATETVKTGGRQRQMWTVGRSCNETGRRPADRGRQAGRRKGVRENEGDGGSLSWKASSYSARTPNRARGFGVILCDATIFYTL